MEMMPMRALATDISLVSCSTGRLGLLSSSVSGLRSYVVVESFGTAEPTHGTRLSSALPRFAHLMLVSATKCPQRTAVGQLLGGRNLSVLARAYVIAEL